MYARVSALILLGIALYATHYAVQLKMFAHGAPGAGLFPLIAAAGLALSSLLWLVQLIREPETGTVEVPQGQALVNLSLQIGAFIAFAVLLALLGYVVAAIVLVVATAWVAGERNPFWIGVVALVSAFGLQAGVRLLGAPL